jgi:aspartate racemase
MTTPGTVGVLGGMGPHATMAFLNKVLALTPAKKDWDHIHLVVDNHPHIPSRARHILYGEPSPVPGMIEACRKLASYPVEFIAVPCNNACWFIDKVRASVGVPVIDIIETTADALAARYPAVKSCAVIAGRVTFAKASYRPFLARHGIRFVPHDEELQTEIERIIEAVKLVANDKVIERDCSAVLERLSGTYAPDAVILGCTEFGCLDPKLAGIPLVDSSHELAALVVRKATGRG